MKLDGLRERFFDGLPRYECLDTLGRGGMGVVFKARDRELDEVVAIKVLSPVFEDEEKAFLVRFKREINLNRKVKHPNVARIFDFGTHREYPYITMEFVPGKDLWTIVHRRGPLPPERAVSILRQIAMGSHAAHAVGIVHRDLKSQNVMVDEGGAVAILDYGLARATAAERITIAATLLGTPQYMSPEQAMGREAGPLSDIYSIGIIAWEVLTGSVPFDGGSPIAIGMRHISEALPPTLGRVPGISPRLVEVLHRCLEKKPDLRPASAADLAAELAAAQPTPSMLKGPRLRLPGDQRTPESVKVLSSRPPSSARPGSGTRGTPSGLRGPAASKPGGAGAAGSAGGANATTEVRAAPPPPETYRTRQMPDAPQTQVRRRKPVVLVVDEDSAEAASMASALQKAGCETVEATSGPQALETLHARKVDMMVLSASLKKGGMDGFDVTRVVRAQPDYAGTPILLTAFRFDRTQFAFAVQAGASDMTSKPVPAPTLTMKVWRLLGSHGWVSPAEREKEKAAVRAAVTKGR